MQFGNPRCEYIDRGFTPAYPELVRPTRAARLHCDSA